MGEETKSPISGKLKAIECGNRDRMIIRNISQELRLSRKALRPGLIEGGHSEV